VAFLLRRHPGGGDDGGGDGGGAYWGRDDVRDAAAAPPSLEPPLSLTLRRTLPQLSTQQLLAEECELLSCSP